MFSFFFSTARRNTPGGRILSRYIRISSDAFFFFFIDFSIKKSNPIGQTHLQTGRLHRISVLVADPDGELGRPSASHFGRGDGQLARVGLDHGLRLKPSGQPAAGRMRRTRHELPEETVFVPVGAANKYVKQNALRQRASSDRSFRSSSLSPIFKSYLPESPIRQCWK